jgi:hypothetical protein
MGDYPHWLAGADTAMPTWFFTLMWVYLGVVMVLLLLSLFISNKKTISLGKFKISIPSILVSGVGFSYIVVVIAAVITISVKAAGFYGATLSGSIFVDLGSPYASWVDFGLKPAYYLACGAAVYLFILGMVRRLVIGKN